MYKKNLSTNYYIALGSIVFLGVVLVYYLKSFLKPVFAAIILAFLVFPMYKALNDRYKNETFAALSVIMGLFLLVLVPMLVFGGIVFSYISNADLSEAKLQDYEIKIYEATGVRVSVADSLNKFWFDIKQDAKATIPKLVSLTSTLLVSMFIMFFVMFYLLVENISIKKNLVLFLPFSEKGSNKLLDESGKVVKAVLIGQVLTAIIQGLLGMFAFIVAGVPGAIFWGMVMILLSIIPLVGAFLVWVPAGLLLIIDGNVGAGIFVLLWGAVVVSNIDNIIRPKLVNKFADIHPLETVLGVFMGIAAFGFIGLILGPLLISLFKILIVIFIKEYA